MAFLANASLDIHNAISNYNADPYNVEWPFVKSPIPIALVAIGYLFLVLKIGPSFMKNREPYDLNGLLIGYNASLVIINFYIAAIIYSAEKGFVTIFSMCHSSNNPVVTYARSFGLWCFFVSKIFELLDTAFMIARKKQSQVSFFHVFHHAFTLFYVWGSVKFFPGYIPAVQAFLNSVVHVIMYSYYMLAALGPQYRKYLWWKRYLTQLQLVQFLITVLYLTSVILMRCNFPLGTVLYSSISCFIFIYLFTDFYIKEYTRSKAKKDVDKAK